MIYRSFLLFSFVLVGVGFSGCSQFRKATSSNYSAGSPQIVAQPDGVTAVLADAADRAAVSLETLAAIEQKQGPEIAVAPVGNAPSQLQRAMTLRWTGPANQLAKVLANNASYSFMEVGSPPSTPIIVNVDVENTPVIEVLRSVGLQMGRRADLRVDGAAQVVEMHYPPDNVMGEF